MRGNNCGFDLYSKADATFTKQDIKILHKMKKKTLLSWSSGKDSAWALHVLRQQQELEVVGLFCTFNKRFERGAMHAVRNELICQQADSVGLPLQLIPIPDPCSDSEYKTIMANFIEQVKSQEIHSIAFGDLFLEEIRSYRENSLAGTGINPVFPLWGLPTRELSKEMVSSGLRAKITCIDSKYLPVEFAGHEYDNSFLEQIPDTIDPCGEKGEFHSFTYDGPMFKHKLNIRVGEIISRAGFIYTDLLPE
jgi:uncharacterized protein (TIGR00290 family)